MNAVRGDVQYASTFSNPFKLSFLLIQKLFSNSKPAQLEGLEVDQYMWGILTTLNTTEVDEVTIDSAANWRPAKNPGMPGIKQEPGEDDNCGGSKKGNKAMSPSSMTLPTLNSWDNLNSAMSPYMPLDMNSRFQSDLGVLNNWCVFLFRHSQWLDDVQRK